MAGNNVNFAAGVGVVENRVNVGVCEMDIVGTHNKGVYCASVIFQEVDKLSAGPNAALVAGSPVGLVLDRDGIDGHSVIFHFCNEPVKKIGPVPVMFFQQMSAVAVGFIVFPFCGWAPW